ncbi:hypothetical protein ACFY4I_27905 [Streptomyces scabiei]|uniref:hypothetical protein n=1 Tax=Streptomyces scabiei TaxID=1930 RepID=UPI0036832F36
MKLYRDIYKLTAYVNARNEKVEEAELAGGLHEFESGRNLVGVEKNTLVRDFSTKYDMSQARVRRILRDAVARQYLDYAGSNGKEVIILHTKNGVDILQKWWLLPYGLLAEIAKHLSPLKTFLFSGTVFSIIGWIVGALGESNIWELLKRFL